MTLDHVKPKGSGGSDDPDNLVKSCYPCNQKRGFIHEIVIGRHVAPMKAQKAIDWFRLHGHKDEWLDEFSSQFQEWIVVWEEWARKSHEIFPHQRSLLSDEAIA